MPVLQYKYWTCQTIMIDRCQAKYKILSFILILMQNNIILPFKINYTICFTHLNNHTPLIKQKCFNPLFVTNNWIPQSKKGPTPPFGPNWVRTTILLLTDSTSLSVKEGPKFTLFIVFSQLNNHKERWSWALLAQVLYAISYVNNFAMLI